jgi:hypothetical protein
MFGFFFGSQFALKAKQTAEGKSLQSRQPRDRTLFSRKAALPGI